MSVTEHDLVVDRELAEISGLLPLLRYATPINSHQQYLRFQEHAAGPDFEYLPLPQMSEIAGRLSSIDPDRTTDPQIGVIARRKKRELEVTLDMLGGRGTDRFFLAAVELYGHVEAGLLELAKRILSTDYSPTRDAGTVTPGQFARAARLEIAHYAEIHPELSAKVTVSETTAGIRVENGNLYIGADVRIPTNRVQPLLQHEIGVHVLTFVNGSAQPLKLFAAGLAGYDENQEALGVLAEHLSGGISFPRLRVLAMRVVAAHMRSSNAEFMETVQELRRLGASTRLAFTTSMRSHRAGGMTRDASYLRGIVRLIEHIAGGGSLDHLLVGKVALEDAPVVKDLRERQVLSAPPLRPRFLEEGDGPRIYEEVRRGDNFVERMAS